MRRITELNKDFLDATGIEQLLNELINRAINEESETEGEPSQTALSDLYHMLWEDIPTLASYSKRSPLLASSMEITTRFKRLPTFVAQANDHS